MFRLTPPIYIKILRSDIRKYKISFKYFLCVIRYQIYLKIFYLNLHNLFYIHILK